MNNKFFTDTSHTEYMYTSCNHFLFAYWSLVIVGGRCCCRLDFPTVSIDQLDEKILY